MFEKLYTIPENQNVADFLTKLQKDNNQFDPVFLKYSLDYININNQREEIIKNYEKFKNFLDYDFVKSFQKDNTISYLGELLCFKILENNNFSFKNSKTKRDQFPDIETVDGDIFEVTTISIDQEKYWGDPIKIEIIDGYEVSSFAPKGGNLKDFDGNECLKFTGKIHTKNQDFLKRKVNGNLIIFCHGYLINPERIISKVLYGNYLQSVNQKGEWGFTGFDDFDKNDYHIKPLNKNKKIISNIKSILFLGDSPYHILSKMIDNEKIIYHHWKNPKFNPDFNIIIN